MSFNRRLASLLLLLLPVTSLLSSCHRDPAVQRQKAISKGDHEFSQAKYPEAMIYYGQALQADKYSAEAHYKLGLCQIKLGSLASAFRELTRAVELQPDNWPAQLQLAQLSLHGGSAQDAKNRALLILRANPQNADAQIVLSSSDEVLGDSKTALKEAQDATEMAPGQPDVFMHLGMLYARAGEAAKAEENLKKAKSLKTNGITPIMTLGNFYQQQRRWNDAANEFQSAITAAPTNPLPRAALATVYMNEGQDALAEKVLTEAKQQLKDDPAAYRMLGDYYLGRGASAKALAEFSALVSQYPKDHQVRKTYIQLLILNRRVDEAASLNNDLLKAAPQDLEAQVLQGEIQLQQGKVDAGILTLQKALTAAPDNAFGHYQMGLALQQKGKTQESETELRAAVRITPSLFEAWQALGESALQRSDWAGLHNIAAELKKIAPRAAEGYLFDATARMHQGDAANAESNLTELIALAPDRPLGYVKLGQLRVIQKRFSEAETQFHQALARDPDSIEALQGLSDVAFRSNKPQEALRLIQSAIDKHSNSAPLYFLQAQALLQNKQPDDAEKTLEKSVQLDKRNVSSLLLLAQLQAGRGDKDRAVSTYQQAIELAPNNMSLQAALGSLYESMGNWQTAQSIYEKVLGSQPENPLASNNLAYLLLEHGGSVNRALILAQAARRGLPDSPNTADTLGWAYYQNGAYSVAAPLLEEAVTKSSDNAGYRYHLGATYQKLKDNTRARTQLEKAISLNPGSPLAEESRRVLQQLAGG